MSLIEANLSISFLSSGEAFSSVLQRQKINLGVRFLKLLQLFGPLTFYYGNGTHFLFFSYSIHIHFYTNSNIIKI